MKNRRIKRQKPPRYIWADCDPDAPRGSRWAFYNTLEDQRSNRPDLKPIKLRVVLNDKLCDGLGGHSQQRMVSPSNNNKTLKGKTQ